MISSFSELPTNRIPKRDPSLVYSSPVQVVRKPPTTTPAPLSRPSTSSANMHPKPLLPSVQPSSGIGSDFQNSSPGTSFMEQPYRTVSPQREMDPSYGYQLSGSSTTSYSQRPTGGFGSSSGFQRSSPGFGPPPNPGLQRPNTDFGSSGGLQRFPTGYQDTSAGTNSGFQRGPRGGFPVRPRFDNRNFRNASQPRGRYQDNRMVRPYNQETNYNQSNNYRPQNNFR